MSFWGFVMRRRAALVALALCVAGLPAIGVGLGAQPAGAAGGTRQISAGGTGRLVSPAFGSGAVQFPEFSAQESEEEPTPGVGPDVDRANSGGNGTGGSATSAKKAKSNPELVASFDGLNHRDQRLANNGNQFSVEPPDQGLCAGNGFVMETVNDVIRVFDTAGQPQTGVIDQNSFYGYPPAINRTTLVRGPFVTDPSCLFDTDTQRWFHVVLTLETVPATGAFTGVNHLDIAVSNTSSPLGTWTIYRLPVQDDGTQGTPDHQCSLGPCIGDYPHIGADSTGFYISTNEYSFFGPEFKAAQIYAFSKAALASGARQRGGDPDRHDRSGCRRQPWLHGVAEHVASGPGIIRQRGYRVLHVLGRGRGGQRQQLQHQPARLEVGQHLVGGDFGSEPDHHADHADGGAVRRAAEVGAARFGNTVG